MDLFNAFIRFMFVADQGWDTEVAHLFLGMLALVAVFIFIPVTACCSIARQIRNHRIKRREDREWAIRTGVK